MQTVLIVIHLMVVTALVVVVLLQRSEGGALGMGGGSGFMTGRGQANVLTRATAILATLFFLTSLGLTLLANYGKGNRSILEGLPPAGTSQPAPIAPQEQKGTALDQLRKLQEQRANGGGVPGHATPAAPSAPAGGETPAPKAAAPTEPTGMPDKPANQAPTAPKP
ncbi:Preprotein translocase, SecG subunit [Beijerinckiaceae bacterium RH AL1]|jgi:preprotein translocase subunit SecG|nr:Preprotein translocase, SecG subunit [Beijerinckiaceae bacterium RH CH11]VVB45615.1 Preprotein translocase, SecG subunit [Beijerinckiaceae bacterium RH AL8]VVC54916.1 Preprotein translocase, SecG subunit [Beijerinckiaceae bacterium RH AL1]